MGDELGRPGAGEKAPLAPKPFQAAMSSVSRRSRTGTCDAAEPKVFAPRPMAAPYPVVLMLSATPTSWPPFSECA